MAAGLLALLDDIALIAKVAAASVDDVGGMAAKASAKAVGVVVDDAAVTPRYVTGFAAARELPIIGRIALGSLRNKLLILLPGCLALSAFAPWAITPLLMLGGAFLCYEGAEKLWELVRPSEKADAPQAADPMVREEEMVKGAIRTDFILSGEIMAISLASVADSPLGTQTIVLAIVGVAITALVYGVVALIVKADDMGVALWRNPGVLGPSGKALGRAIVRLVPRMLAALGGIGMAAMLWVGGGIVLHGLEAYGLAGLGHGLAALAAAAQALGGPVLGWAVGATGAGLFGAGLGAVIVAALHLRAGH
jgi:predicted DNA repair protein MutK